MRAALHVEYTSTLLPGNSVHMQAEPEVSIHNSSSNKLKGRVLAWATMVLTCAATKLVYMCAGGHSATQGH